MGHGSMWSTHVDGLMIPLRWHSAQSGCSALKALDSLIQRHVLYGAPDRSRTYRSPFSILFG